MEENNLPCFFFFIPSFSSSTYGALPPTPIHRLFALPTNPSNATISMTRKATTLALMM